MKVSIGEKLKGLRTHLKMTQVELGQEIGLSNTYISELETGKAKCSSEAFKKYMPVSVGTDFELTTEDFFTQ